ncbi:hypothetical protein [Streptomyces sp. NPDC048623]|uniref:hypothetical protein n=1 Tax=Streptomyces sp. NPDC048623 TaxID=3155761 RepID=UPI0034459121
MLSQGTQSLLHDRLRWDVESSCAACGYAVAVCDHGPPPPERRAQILAEHGLAELHLSGTRDSGVVVMRVLRAALGLSLAEARDTARRVGEGGWTGTRPEAERLARRLRAAGVPAEVRPGVGGGGTDEPEARATAG